MEFMDVCRKNIVCHLTEAEYLLWLHQTAAFYFHAAKEIAISASHCLTSRSEMFVSLMFKERIRDIEAFTYLCPIKQQIIL